MLLSFKTLMPKQLLIINIKLQKITMNPHQLQNK